MLRLLLILSLLPVTLSAQERIQFNILMLPENEGYTLAYEKIQKESGNGREKLLSTSQDTFLLWLTEALDRQEAHKRQILFYIHGMWGSLRGNFERVYAMLQRQFVTPDESDIAYIVSLKWPGNDYEYKDNKSRIASLAPVLKEELTPLLRKFQLEQYWRDEGISRWDALVHSLGNELMRQWLRDLPDEEYAYPLFDKLVFAASDLDADQYESDTLLYRIHDLARHCYIYYSERDLTLEVSTSLNKSERLGRSGPADYSILPLNTSVIDVSLVRDETNFPDLITGHSYFRSSPLVGRDMLNAFMDRDRGALDYMLEKDSGKNHFLISPKEAN